MLWSPCCWPVSLDPTLPEMPTTPLIPPLAQHWGEAIGKSWLATSQCHWGKVRSLSEPRFPKWGQRTHLSPWVELSEVVGKDVLA